MTAFRPVLIATRTALRCRPLLVIAVAALLFCATVFRATAESVALAAAPADSDTWSVTIMHGAPCQAVHRVSQRQPDGSRRIVNETRALIEFLGQKQEIRQRIEAVVDASFQVLSVHATSEGQSGRMTTEGQVRDGRFVVRCQRGDSQFERSVSLAEGPIFDLCLADALAARTESPGSPASEVKVLEEESWGVRRVLIERLADRDGKRCFRVTQPDVGTSQLWTLVADGSPEQVEFTLPTRLQKRATADEAAGIKYVVYADRQVLSFAVERDLPFPERLKSLTLRLTWRDAPPDIFDFEDARQQIIEQTHDGNRHQVDLRLSQPPAVAETTPATARDETLTSYLADDDYIRPQDPGIRKQARKWTAGATAPLDIVRRLTHEVSNYLQGGELIAETLSGPEVLACRKGKCTEYTILLASLTRSQNLPTRVALGMRMVGGRWIGHMWCEVWLGRWTPVDASADEVGGSPALLKIVDSSTVMGTQRARWEIADSLELAILDVERDPSLRSNLTTGVVRQTYTNADYACRLKAPGSDWRVEDKSKPGTVTVRWHLPGKFEQGEPFVHFVAFALPGGLNASTVVNARKSQFEKAYQGFEVVADEAQAVGPHAGRRFTFRQADPRSEGKHLKTTEFIWTAGGAGYLLNLIAAEAVHESVLRDFESLLANFEILRDADPPAEAKP